MEADKMTTNTDAKIIETIEVGGEYIMEHRHHHERRQHQLAHNHRYERRLNNRRNARSNKIDITI